MREAVASLQRSKSLIAAARAPEFVRRLEGLRALCLEGPGETRLEAMALLFRIGAVAKALKPKIERIVSEVTTAPDVAPQLLSDPDDRRYVGEALRLATGDWKPKYLARAVVEEVSGEEARAAFTTGLVSASETLAEAFEALCDAFSAWSVGTADTGTSRARRLIRVVTALKGAIVALDPNPGDKIGQTLHSLARAALSGEQVGDPLVQSQAAAALLELLSTLLRFHFSLASDNETFAVVSMLRRWFHPRDWPPDLTEKCQEVARQISEALVFLAKQGINDEALRKTLLDVLGESEGSVELRRLANDVPGIPNETRAWLLAGRRSAIPMAAQEAIEETVLRSVDRAIAELFRDSEDLELVLDRLQDDMAAAFGAYEPKLVPSADRLVSTIRRVARRVHSLAERRSLRFGGRVGDAAVFSPVDHEQPVDGIVTRVVRIKRPSVERSIEGSPPIVVLKAEVESDERVRDVDGH
jgi:hypothetical protein